MAKTSNALTKLLDEVDALCGFYIGKDAPSEQWAQMCERLVKIDKLRKGARKVAETNYVPRSELPR